MTDPTRSSTPRLSRSEVVLFTLVLIIATSLTIAGTYSFLEAFMLHDPRGSLAQPARPAPPPPRQHDPPRGPEPARQ
jgi:hypothetical protein